LLIQNSRGFKIAPGEKILIVEDVVTKGGRVQETIDIVRANQGVVAGVAMVVSGHSHKASVQVRDGVVFFNPGSAGPRRFSLPVTVGFVTVEDGVEASVKELAV